MSQTQSYSWSPSDFAPREFLFNAASLQMVETNAAPLSFQSGTNKKKNVRAFDKDTEEYANSRITLPDDLDTTGTYEITATVWAATAAASKNIGITFGYSVVADGADWDVGYTELDSGAVSIDATQDNVTYVSLTGNIADLTGWAAGVDVDFRISRDVSVADNLQSDMYLDSMVIKVSRT